MIETAEMPTQAPIKSLPEETIIPKQPNGKAKKKHQANSYIHALELQKVAMRTLHSDGVKPSEVGQLIKAWESLERLKRDMRMKPNPSRIKPPVKPSKRSSAQATFEE